MQVHFRFSFVPLRQRNYINKLNVKMPITTVLTPEEYSGC